MAGNALVNASFLDGASNWRGRPAADLGDAATVVLTVLEAGVGAVGRLALVGTATSAGAGSVYVLESDPVAVANGAVLEAQTLMQASGGAVSASVMFSATIGGATTEAALTTVRSATSAADRGLPSTFHAAYGRPVAPQAGYARLRIALMATGGGQVKVIASKPYLNVAPPVSDYVLVWDPGPNGSADLNLPVWPASLPPLLDEGYSPTPVPRRKGYAGEAGVTDTWHVNGGGWLTLKGQMSLTDSQHADLVAFYDSFNGEDQQDFWFVRPDTAELMRARWAPDGDPTDTAKVAGRFRTTFGLLLERV